MIPTEQEIKQRYMAGLAKSRSIDRQCCQVGLCGLVSLFALVAYGWVLIF